MKLKFFAKPDHVVHYPGPRFAGQIHNYVGRVFVVNTDEKSAQETRVAGQNRATKEGIEIDSESNEGRALMGYAAQGGLWCANAETAAAVGVPFVKVKFDEESFEWIAGVAPEKSSKSVSKE